jgi:hypothetical protein
MMEIKQSGLAAVPPRQTNIVTGGLGWAQREVVNRRDLSCRRSLVSAYSRINGTAPIPLAA